MTEGHLLAGAVPTTATYDPPAKYKGKKNARGDLVGTRIPTGTPLGDELAKLRLSWHAAARIGLDKRQDEIDQGRRLLETSANVPIDPSRHAYEVWRKQRVTAIRTRITQVIEDTVAIHGRPPTTIGIPAETIDEVREACCDFDVVFTVS